MANDIKNKAASVGADYHVSNPEITMLVECVVKVIRERQGAVTEGTN